MGDGKLPDLRTVISRSSSLSDASDSLPPSKSKKLIVPKK